MPFGLKNAPDTFQRSMDVVLAQVKWRTALEYLYHIVILFKAADEHVTHLKHVLTLL